MGGSPDPPPDRSLQHETNSILHQLTGTELGNYRNYFNQMPLLQGSQNLALLGQQQLPGIQAAYQGDIGQLQDYQSQLAALQGQIPSFQGQLTGYQDQLQNYLNQVPGFQQQIAGYQSQIPGLQSQFQKEFAGYQKPLQGGLDYLAPVIASGGALTAQEKNLADQQSQAAFAARGNLYGNQSAGADLLNRDQYKQTKLAQDIGLAQGLGGTLGGLSSQNAAIQQGLLGLGGQFTNQQAGLGQYGAGLIGQQAGLTNQNAALAQLQAGLVGQGAGLTGMEAGLTGQYQNAIGQAINPALQTQLTGIGTYATLLDPLLNYGSDLYNTNYNAQAASNIAGGNKGSSIAGGAISLIGSAAAAY